MDVNVAGSNINLRKDGLSNLLDKQSTVANAGLPVDGIQKPGDNSRTTEQVNQATKVDSEELNQAVSDIAASMNVMQKGLAFKVDEESGIQIVKVIDVTTGELIRQIPNEEALDIAKKLNEVTGLLMKTEV
ncbi:flagellar protein FlaG [Shewanella sp. SR44-4]|uniref:flagellar protein FlaG n=1 Tax=Shewanella sp. SR44-4 TaxID=2760935 RepID=UPI00160438DA|nr:flagellar protein FlaG [Shewanella sp. SR44-4]MBB1361908.1 flagellar protein FlaG [Shewanella sp. SR44-4]